MKEKSNGWYIVNDKIECVLDTKEPWKIEKYEEYMKRYTTCQLVEIDSKMKKIDKTSQKLSPLGMIGIIFIAILIYSFKFIIRENLFVGLFIFLFYFFGGLIICLLTQKPTIKNMILKDNVIELYNSLNLT